MGQSVGPVFGGFITEYFGFRAIFWALFVISSIVFMFILFFLPETLRTIAGNGSIPLRGFHRPLIDVIQHRLRSDNIDCIEYSDAPSSDVKPAKDKHKAATLLLIFKPFTFLLEKDVFVTLTFGAYTYTVWSMVTASATDVFQDIWRLSDLHVGLIFLPNGAGCMLGSYLTGWMMDRDFSFVEKQYRERKGIEMTSPLSRKTLAATDFPIERARLREAYWIVPLFILSTALYGYAIQWDLMSFAIALQFFVAFAATSLFTINSTLMVDLYPGASAGATAVNNLVRCLLGASGVAVALPIVDTIGSGPTFLIFSLSTVVLCPLLIAEWVYGMRWRLDRLERIAV